MLVAALAPVSAAGAQTDAGERGDGPSEGPYLQVSDLGEGTCDPAVTAGGTVVDCWFPILSGTAELNPLGGPYQADTDVPYDNENEELAECRISHDAPVSPALLCRDIQTYSESGTRRVSVVLGFEDSAPLASFEVVPPEDLPVEGYLHNGYEPVTYTGHPLTLSLWRNSGAFDDPDLTVWGLVRPRYGEAVVASTPIAVPDPGSYASADGDLTFDTQLDPGRYRLDLCRGVSARDCEELPVHLPFQVVDITHHELVAGHNRADAERINMVFVGSGWEDSSDMAAMATELLGLDGPVLYGEDWKHLGEDAIPSEVWSIEFGPFATEPIASAVDRFNFWYLDADLVDPRGLFHDSDPEFENDLAEGMPYPHTVVVSLHLQGPGVYGRSEANWTSLKGRRGPELLPVEQVSFGGIYLALDHTAPQLEADTLTHEMGHAIFELRDEYYEADRPVIYGYPNCAPSEDVARRWWGDLVGEVDPAVYTWIDYQKRYYEYFGEEGPATLVDWVTVRPTAGGCYDGTDDVVRPTEDSIMNSQIPVFGAVNRRRVESILGLFSGRAVLSDPADLSLRCQPAALARSGQTVRCWGELAPFVDPPEGGITVAAPGSPATCTTSPAIGDADSLAVDCDPVTLSGTGPWSITGSFEGSGARVVEILRPPPAPARTPGTNSTGSTGGTGSTGSTGSTGNTENTGGTGSTTAPAGEGDNPNRAVGNGQFSAGWVMIGGLVALVVIGAGGLWLQSVARREDEEGAGPPVPPPST